MGPLVLFGLDVGSTTCHAVAAVAQVRSRCVSGRMELCGGELCYRSQPVFTPFVGDDLDIDALAGLIDGWLAEAGLTPAQLAGGGAIVTGLAANTAQAPAVRRLVQERISAGLVATTQDPHLESWLAFFGSCAALCQADPARLFLNLDIGGGTSNLALGRGDTVLLTDVLQVGARHLRFVPGSYRLIAASPVGGQRLASLGIENAIGRELSPPEVAALCRSFVAELEERVVLHTDQPGRRDAAVVFSGGVGELIYQARQQLFRHPVAASDALPVSLSPTAFGDLGGELAAHILASPILARDVHSTRPQMLGRATVCGLALHNVEVSGSTLYLPDPGLLPLADLPVVATLPYTATDAELAAAFALARRAATGACIALCGMPTASAVALGQRLRSFLPMADAPPVVIILDGNGGKTLGNYATDWGNRPGRLIVLDEIRVPAAQFVTLGRRRHTVVPLSFYGRSRL
ncbi:MAG TPA: ethanolamine ammonia-lyase reactivating factor EutA [Pseudomonadota bacterium]|nr:ethanolamine ammonia-lyase reactivating factor EutA [Pseudomonadota bacterium]